MMPSLLVHLKKWLAKLSSGKRKKMYIFYHRLPRFCRIIFAGLSRPCVAVKADAFHDSKSIFWSKYSFRWHISIGAKICGLTFTLRQLLLYIIINVIHICRLSREIVLFRKQILAYIFIRAPPAIIVKYRLAAIIEIPMWSQHK